MAETIVQCDGCGAHGRRAENAAAPDFWFYLESVDRTFGKDGVYIVWACSEACRDGMWKRGPGRGKIDDEGTFRRREQLAKAPDPDCCTECGLDHSECRCLVEYDPDDDPLQCCPRATWGDGTHDIGCRGGGKVH